MAKKKSTRPNALDQLKEVAVKNVVPTTADSKPVKPAAERARHLDRLTADLPEGMKDEVIALAKKHDCKIGDIAALLLWQGLKMSRAGTLSIDPMLVPIRSLKSNYGLNVDYEPPEQTS